VTPLLISVLSLLPLYDFHRSPEEYCLCMSSPSYIWSQLRLCRDGENVSSQNLASESYRIVAVQGEMKFVQGLL